MPRSSQSSNLSRTRAKPPVIDLGQPGWLSASNMFALFNVSPATFYAGLKVGRFPPADGKVGKRPYWKTSTARAALE